MEWIGYQTGCGGWQWQTQVTEEWSAVVSDDSQVSAPRQTTRYHPSACSRMEIVGHREFFSTLADAKDEAIKLTIRVIKERDLKGKR